MLVSKIMDESKNCICTTSTKVTLGKHDSLSIKGRA